MKTRLQWVLVAISLASLVVLPFLVRDSALAMVNLAALDIIAVLGLQIIMGYCGQINIGQSAFVGVGAYAAAVLAGKLGLPFWAAVPLAALIAGCIGVVVGMPSLRIKGFYLALSSIAFMMIFEQFVTSAASLTGGAGVGMSVPKAGVGDLVFWSEQHWYFLIVLVTLAMTLLTKNLARANTGRAWIAIRDNDIAASAMGFSLFRYKLLAFFLCAAYAGVSGALLAFYVGKITSDYFTLMESIWFLGMVILGGSGTVIGAVFGVAFVRGLQQFVNLLGPKMAQVFPVLGGEFTAALALIVFGVAIIVFLVVEPRGLAHSWEKFKLYYRMWPFSRD